MKSSVFLITNKVKDSPSHTRSQPLSHLFYLLSEGSSSLGIAPLGMETAFDILIGALPELNKRADYKQVMHATLNRVYDIYGVCSEEYNALIKPWTNACLDTEFNIKHKGSVLNFSECEYFTTGEVEACWIWDNAQICLNLPDSIIHGINPNHNTWTITGPGSADFESAGGMSGNQQQGGMCLKITSIPELAYYPRVNNIRLDFTTNEGSMSLNHRLLIYDCTGTKPDCESYHGQRQILAPNENEDTDSSHQEELESQPQLMEVFDVVGRLIYHGKTMDFTSLSLPSNQVLIIRYYDSKSQLLKTQKLFFAN